MSQDENPQIAARRAKLEALIAAGVNPYPNDFRPENSLNGLFQAYEHEHDEAVLAQAGACCAGRIMLLRSFGKLTFAHMRDESGQMQIAVQRDEVGADRYREIFRKVEVGDILGVRGTLFRTRTGELTIRVAEFQLLTKSLRPLPEKWHGLEDVETRYRQRYVDLIVNPEVRDRFHTRSQIIRLLRTGMEKRGFLEVETPMMHPIPGGAVARPFVTHHNALGQDLYLRIAPELYLKRLIVGGFERVFEINRNFRNEGLSVRHNPEFTTMEFYQAYSDYRELMQLTRELLTHVVQTVHGTLQVTHQGREIDFSTWDTLTIPQALVKHVDDCTEANVADRDYLWLKTEREIFIDPNNGEAKEFLKVDPKIEIPQLQINLFETAVEKRLLNPTFIVDYPIPASPLSRRSDANPEVAERFELFIGGWEIANAFSELNDPADQAARFRIQAAAKDSGDEEAMHFDADYIRALEYGMPPTAGEGIGIDRLVMLLTDAASIRDVLLFPQLRNLEGA